MVKRFRAASMAEALKQVKAEFGPDAIILESRRRGWPGPFSHVEVVAASGNSLRVPSDLDKAAGVAGGNNHQEEPAPGGRQKAAEAYQQWAVPALQSDEGAEEQEAGGHDRGGAADPIDEKAGPADAPGATDQDEPAEERWRLLLAPLGLTPSLTAQLARYLTFTGIQLTGTQLDASPLAVVLAEWFAAQEGFFVDREAYNFKAGAAAGSAPRVLAFIGPPGSGKTATVAKLAGQILARKGGPLGLISLSRRQPAVPEELAALANNLDDIIHLTVANPAEIAAAREELAHCPWVLVDTDGFAPGDPSSIGLLQADLKALAPAETHLTIPASLDQVGFAPIVASCRQLQPSHLVVTKLDETSARGLLLEAPTQLKIPLSFLGVGDDPAAGLERASADGCALWVTAGLAASKRGLNR